MNISRSGPLQFSADNWGTVHPIELNFCFQYSGENSPSDGLGAHRLRGLVSELRPRKRRKVPCFPLFRSFELTVLRDRKSDRDEIFTRNRSIMGVHDPADTIDLAQSGAEREGRIGQKPHIPTLRRLKLKLKLIFELPAIGLPRNDNQVFWNPT